jgi:hypothetical protein
MTDGRADVLRFWRAIERFNPQDLTLTRLVRTRSGYLVRARASRRADGRGIGGESVLAGADLDGAVTAGCADEPA